MRLELFEPVKWGSETIAVLEFQPLKAKHIRGVSPNPKAGDLLDLVSKSTAQPAAMIDEMSAADALRAMEIVGGFLQRSPQTGENVSV